MKMPSQTPLVWTLAIASVAMLASHPARAEECRTFRASQPPVTYDCRLSVTYCSRKLDAAAGAAYGRWKKDSFVSEPSPCRTGVTVNCSAHFCKDVLRTPGLTGRLKLKPGP
jgi:hypothetical protein